MLERAHIMYFDPQVAFAIVTTTLQKGEKASVGGG